jgi:ribosomal protein S18 acetylase RimI-like enzyme
MTSVTINQERPDSEGAASLIEELESHLATLYPIQSRHGFSVQKLIQDGVDLFVLRDGATAAGCGGIMFVGNEFAELKRMYVRPVFRGRGFGRMLLLHLENHARSRGVPVLRLETGIHQREAIKLYEGFGFVRIGPFAMYTDDPLSRCYEKKL